MHRCCTKYHFPLNWAKALWWTSGARKQSSLVEPKTAHSFLKKKKKILRAYRSLLRSQLEEIPTAKLGALKRKSEKIKERERGERKKRVAAVFTHLVVTFTLTIVMQRKRSKHLLHVFRINCFFFLFEERENFPSKNVLIWNLWKYWYLTIFNVQNFTEFNQIWNENVG